MEIHEERIRQSLYKELGVRVGIPLLIRHHQRGQEVYLVSWLMERPNPQEQTHLIEPSRILRMYCDKKGLAYLDPSIILWSSGISPGRTGIVGQISTNGPGSEKFYFIRDTNRARIYLPIMEPYLIWLKGNMDKSGKNAS